MPVALPALAAIATVGVGAASAAGAFNPDAPDPINYGQINRDAQQAQIDLLPAKVAAHEAYDPISAAANQRVAYQNLFGRKPGQRQVTYTETVHVPAKYGPSSTLPGGARSGPQQTLLTPAHDEQVLRTKWVNDTGAPGTLDMLERATPRLVDLGNRAQSSVRASEIQDVFNLGPKALEAFKNYDPASTGLADSLAARAKERLDANGALDPFMRRQLSQNIRGAQSARGFGTGTNDAAAEAYYQASTQEQRRRDSEQFAGGVLSQRAALYGDPFQTLLGRSSGRSVPNVPMANTPSLVQDNVDPFAYQVAGQNQAASNAANIAGYNSQMSGIGSLVGGVGQLGGIYAQYGNPFSRGLTPRQIGAI